MSRWLLRCAATLAASRCAVCLIPPAGAADGPPARLWLVERTNGEPLRCGIEEYDAASGHWVFRMEFSGRPFAFDGAQIIRIRPLIRALAPHPPHWILETTDGDRIVGSTPFTDERSVGLTHPQAGALLLDRRRVRELRQEVEPAVLYEGFSIGEVWESPKGAVRVGPDGLEVTASAPVGRRIQGLPRGICVEFAMPRPTPFSVLLFSTQLNRRAAAGSAYQMLYFMPALVQLLRLQPYSMTTLGTHSIQRGMLPSGPVRYRAYADLGTGRFLLMENERIVSEWRDLSPPADYGEMLGFQTHGSTLKLADLRVSRWHGRHPIEPDEDPPEKRRDRVHLVNGDVAWGEALSIRDNLLTFRSTVGELKLPADRVAHLRFRRVEAEAARAPDAPVFRLADGSQLRLVLQVVRNAEVTAIWRDRQVFRFPIELLKEAVWPERTPAAPPDPTPRTVPRFSQILWLEPERTAGRDHA